MLWAQVFGLHRGFVCDCGGALELTQFDHCHGPHSEACHDHAEESPCHHDADDHPDDPGTREHAALIERLTTGSVTNMHVMAPAPLISVIEVPAWLAGEPDGIIGQDASASVCIAEPSRPRSWPRLLTHTVALRI
jgi:hypothetical protein